LQLLHGEAGGPVHRILRWIGRGIVLGQPILDLERPGGRVCVFEPMLLLPELRVVIAPTLLMTTAPGSLASCSWSFSRSKIDSVVSSSALIWLMRLLVCSASPAPSTMRVSYLVMTILCA